jgi:L-methionine (R)-S-oxide reductase
MSESILITHKDKEGIYKELLPQIESVISQETDIIANQANISAILKEAFKFLWVGFYRVDKDNDELVLGPFQGPLACTRIKFGRGVCGTAWKENKVIIVPDVDKFPGHIACSSASKSEIVIPILKNEKVIGVLDIDSEKLGYFDEIDALWLHKIIDLYVSLH